MRLFLVGLLLGGAVSALITYVLVRLETDREWEERSAELHRRYASGRRYVEGRR